MSATSDYWRECVAVALEEAGAPATDEQIRQIAKAVEGGHDNYGMAFYSPPSSDRMAALDNEWKARFDHLQREYDDYRGNAEAAVRRALRQHSDARLTIGEGGEVLRHGGRTERIL